MVLECLLNIMFVIRSLLLLFGFWNAVNINSVISFWMFTDINGLFSIVGDKTAATYDIDVKRLETILNSDVQTTAETDETEYGIRRH